MPQTFQVLRCYKCSVFQVHQTTKSKKWECKLCGEKQSLKRYYGLGTAKECRFHVQKLNGMREELDAAKMNTDQDSDSSTHEEILIEPVKDNYKPVKNSKWSNYVEELETVEQNTTENISLGGAEAVLEIPKKRRKQDTNDFKKNPKILAVEHGKNPKKYIALPVIVPNTNYVVTTKSKTAKPNLHSEVYQPEETIKTSKHNNIKKFIPPVINKKSKWARFTEKPAETEKTDVLAPFENLDTPSESIQQSSNDVLFSWCDDSDIDNILKI